MTIADYLLVLALVILCLLLGIIVYLLLFRHGTHYQRDGLYLQLALKGTVHTLFLSPLDIPGDCSYTGDDDLIKLITYNQKNRGKAHISWGVRLRAVMRDPGTDPITIVLPQTIDITTTLARDLESKETMVISARLLRYHLGMATPVYPIGSDGQTGWSFVDQNIQETTILNNEESEGLSDDSPTTDIEMYAIPGSRGATQEY